MSKKKLQINLAFLTSSDPRDRTSWSGIYSFMLGELEERFEYVEVIGPISRPILLRILIGIVAVFHKVAFRKNYDKLRSTLLSRYYSRVISRKLKKSTVDVIYAPAGSTEIAYLNTSIPICYYSDSSFAQISNYYDQYKDISDRSKRESDQIERKAIERSGACVYSSSWAADFVCDYYHKPQDKVYVAKFGANLIPQKSIEHEHKSARKEFNLLFLGVDWTRKGGAKAVATYNFLKAKGYPVSLTICGCDPEIEGEGITIIPFMDKNKEADRQELQRIMLQTHLMLLPTETDCTPIVLNEAAAFGIPVIATHTGGIPSQVEHGVNGYLAVDSNDFFQYSELLINDPMLYNQMSSNALTKYQTELNWDKWGEQIAGIIGELAHNARSSR